MYFMRLKTLFFFIAMSFACFLTYARDVAEESIVIANEDSCTTESIQSAIDACIMLAQSAQSNDPEALLKAKEALMECNLKPFSSLRPQNRDEVESLDGHLVFNVAFADSLAQGKDAYRNADSINKSTADRGQMAPGKISTKTFLVKANGKSVYNFISKDRQELAVVAEPGGRVSTRIHAVNPDKGINEWHNDTVDVAKGKNSRKTSFTLPHTPSSKVCLEITNCTGIDISVVVISN